MSQVDRERGLWAESGRKRAENVCASHTHTYMNTDRLHGHGPEPSTLGGPALGGLTPACCGLMLCCCHLDFLNNFSMVLHWTPQVAW